MLGQPEGNCMATMLSHQGDSKYVEGQWKSRNKLTSRTRFLSGRSFTFNRSADGYQRGEGQAFAFRKLGSVVSGSRRGCGSVFVKLYQGDKRDEEERVCALAQDDTRWNLDPSTSLGHVRLVATLVAILHRWSSRHSSAQQPTRTCVKGHV